MKINLRKTYIILVSVICFVSAAADDSIAVRQLEDLVVTGDRCWIEDNVVNYIPTKKEKRLSNSPASMIKSMHLPILRERDGSIVNAYGEGVEIFINGERATEIDIAAFWPKDVKRVQYVENSRDPRFEGARYAVNFITTRYKLGGVSKIDLFQKIPTNGFYTLSSKLAYKKMSYGVLASYSYYRDNRSETTAETEYDDIYYSGDFHDRILRTEQERRTERENNLSLAFNAKYTGSKFYATHTFSLALNRKPYNGSTGSNSWSDNLFDSSSSFDTNKSKTVSPQVSGKYIYVFSDKWYLTGQWSYAHSNNKAHSWSQIGDTDIVYNESVENVDAGGFSLVPTFLCSKKVSLQLKLSSTLNWFHTRYGGSVQTNTDMSTQDMSVSAKIYWMASEKMYMSLEPGVIGAFKQIGDIDRNSLIPFIYASLSYNPSRKFQIGGRLNFYTQAPSASESNPVLVKASELMWVLGNPHLRNMESWEAYISSTHIPSGLLSINYGFGYNRTTNDVINTYIPADRGTGGLIRQKTNAKPSDNLRASISAQLSLLDNSLSIGISPGWYYTHFREGTFRNLNCVTVSADADYTLKNCRFSIRYDGPFKGIDCNGMEKSWSQDSWNASIVYGLDSFYVEGRIENIFNRRHRSWSEFSSPNYSVRNDNLEIGRRVSINLTYTFGYGKRINRDFDIDGPSSVETSVVKTI